MLRRWPAIALGLLACAWGALPARAAEPTYLLWSVAGTRNTVYLLGSVHLLGRDEFVWSSGIEQAYHDAESLVFEIDLDDLDPTEMQRLTLELGQLPAGRSLRDVLGADLYQALAQHAGEVGIELATLQRFRPWLAALAIVHAQLNALGMSQEAGVEQRFLDRALADRKPVLGLETPAEGLQALASLSSDRQREFVAYTLAEADSMATELEAMVQAWQQGDTAALAALLERGFDAFPDLYGPLTVTRNLRWVDVLDDLLERDDDYLVVVGALHLVGDDSLIDLLHARGFAITRH